MISKIKRILLIFYMLVYSLGSIIPVYGTEIKTATESDVDTDEVKEIPESSTVTEFEGSDEEAFKQSLVASQFAVPFGSTFYHTLSDPVIKETLTDLYDGGSPKEQNYIKLLKKDKNGDYKDARVIDLLSTDDNGNSIEFFINYEYEEYNEDLEEMETFTEYEKVYYSNPYTYFYLTLFLAYQPSLAEEFMAVASYPVDMDNYGNIVINDSATNKRHRRMVVPNIINPMLNEDDSYFLPTMRFIYMYNTDMSSLASVGSMTSDQLKQTHGSKLPSNKFSMYSIEDSASLSILDVLLKDGKNKLSSYLTLPRLAVTMGSITAPSSDFVNYINTSDSGSDDSLDWVMFAFGNNFEPGFFNRFQNDMSYGSLNEIMTTGIGKRNSSMAVLPESRLYLGNSNGDIRIERGSIDVVDKKGNTKGGYKFYYNDFESVLDGALNTSTAGQVGNITSKEIALAMNLTGDFFSNMNIDKMVNIVYNSVDKKSEDGKPSESIVNKPEDAYDQKVNNIVNSIDFFFGNVGTAFSSMTSSKMSKQYFNLSTAFNENLLFNMTDVLEDPFVVNMLGKYMNGVIAIALAIYLLALIQYRGSDKHDLISYFKSTMFGVLLCILPLIIFSVYIRDCNFSTEYILQDSYVNWFIGDINTDNGLSDKEINMDKQLYGYFKEANSLPKKNKGIVSFYDSVPDEDGSYIKKTSLNELNRVGLNRGSGTDEDTIYANTDSYYKSVFFYFYDTFRWHMYNYYGGQVPGWDNANGLVESKDNFIKMINDPGFLYGQSYLSQESELIANNIQAINYKSLEVQDILGLTHLHTQEEVAGRDSYNSDIIGSYWYRVMFDNMKNTKSTARGSRLVNELDSSEYSDRVIHGSKLYGDSLCVTDYSNFELSLQSINRKVASELQKLSDYKGCLDETVLYTASLIATFEYNKEMNKYLDNGYKLYPTTFESSTYSMDTVYRSIFMRDFEQESLYDGDLMLAIESQGGFIVQGLTLVSTFVGQVVGLEKLIGSILIFILSVVVFVFAYNVHKNLFNKAWLGLLGLFLSLVTVHALFLYGVNIICVPEYSLIRTSLFGSYLPGLKIFLLLVLLIVNGAAIVFIVYFAFKYYKDLGGSIIASRIEQFAGNLSGIFTGYTTDSSHESDSADLHTNSTNMDTDDIEVESDGTVQFNQRSSDDDIVGVQAAEASISDMDITSPVNIDDADSNSSSVFSSGTVNNNYYNNTDARSAFEFDNRSNSVASTLSQSSSLHNSHTDSLTNANVDFDSSVLENNIGGTENNLDVSTQDNKHVSDVKSSSMTDSKSLNNTYNSGNNTCESVTTGESIESTVQSATVETVSAQSSVTQSSTGQALSQLTDFMDDSSQALKKNNLFNQLHQQRENRGDKK